MTFARSDTRNVLILWDIDHTLIETRGVGREAFAVAFEQVTGRPLERMPHITGRTEPDIYAAVAALHEIQDPPPFPTFAQALATAYSERQDELYERGRVMPDTVRRSFPSPSRARPIVTSSTATTRF
ncbi:HAD family hydrolase [Nocardia tengchongensis]|uniref:hypothetical protein n=1 Tax=Nocardia tengchongensis TaxID=2055889 RepID=UPI0036CBDBC6